MFWRIIIAFSLLHFIVAGCNLKIGVDYDDTLSFSTPAFQKAFAVKNKKVEPFSQEFWKIVNANFELETKKWGVVAWVLALKTIGFDIVVITARLAVGSDELVDSWDWLHDGFYFTEDKSLLMKRHHFIAFIGDSDSDIEEARKAEVIPIRARRSPKSSYKENYSPGKYGEWELPFSD